MKSQLIRNDELNKKFRVWEPPMREDAISLCGNKELQDLLGVDMRLIKKYRDSGKLGYIKEGDKYWYPFNAVKCFLESNYYPPFYKKP